MKILFIQFAPGYYIAPMLLSSMLKKQGHIVKIIVDSDIKNILNSVRSFNPNLVAFSCTTGNHVWVAEVAKKIKEHFKVITIAGGPHPTYFTDFINEEGIDVIARGEAEHA